MSPPPAPARGSHWRLAGVWLEGRPSGGRSPRPRPRAGLASFRRFCSSPPALATHGVDVEGYVGGGDNQRALTLFPKHPLPPLQGWGVRRSPGGGKRLSDTRCGHRLERTPPVENQTEV